MKKLATTRLLQLATQTVRDLRPADLRTVIGGADATAPLMTRTSGPSNHNAKRLAVR